MQKKICFKGGFILLIKTPEILIDNLSQNIYQLEQRTLHMGNKTEF